MTMAHVLRSRVNGNGHARFWSGGGVGDRPADHNHPTGGSRRVFRQFSSTTTVVYKIAHLADNGGKTKPLEG